MHLIQIYKVHLNALYSPWNPCTLFSSPPINSIVLPLLKVYIDSVLLNTTDQCLGMWELLFKSAKIVILQSAFVSLQIETLVFGTDKDLIQCVCSMEYVLLDLDEPVLIMYLYSLNHPHSFALIASPYLFKYYCSLH
jgi:hypothetical protein